MDAKELRIENLVNFEFHKDSGGTKAINVLASDLIKILHFEKSKFYKPIPLTEEWLLRFKEVEKKVFDSEETGYGVEYHIKINENLIMNIQDDMSFCLESISDDSKYVYLENDFLDTVHFLQNIYNVLTKGKELTIK